MRRSLGGTPVDVRLGAPTFNVLAEEGWLRLRHHQHVVAVGALAKTLPLLRHLPPDPIIRPPDIVVPGHPVQVFQGDVVHPRLLQAAGYRDVRVVGGGDVAAQFV